MSRGVAWTVIHLGLGIADRHSVPVRKPAVRLEDLDRVKLEAHALRVELRDPELILALRSFNRYSERARKHRGSPAMIDVAVGQQDFFDGHTEFGRGRLDAIQITTRVDDRGAFRGFADGDRAVLLERSHGDDREFHGRWKNKDRYQADVTSIRVKIESFQVRRDPGAQRSQTPSAQPCESEGTLWH